MGMRIPTNGSVGLRTIIMESLNMTFLKITNELRSDRITKLKC